MKRWLAALLVGLALILGAACTQDMEPSPSTPDAGNGGGPDAATSLDGGQLPDAAPAEDAAPEDGGPDDGGMDGGDMDGGMDGGLEDAGGGLDAVVDPGP